MDHFEDIKQEKLDPIDTDCEIMSERNSNSNDNFIIYSSHVVKEEIETESIPADVIKDKFSSQIQSKDVKKNTSGTDNDEESSGSSTRARSTPMKKRGVKQSPGVGTRSGSKNSLGGGVRTRGGKKSASVHGNVNRETSDRTDNIEISPRRAGVRTRSGRGGGQGGGGAALTASTRTGGRGRGNATTDSGESFVIDFIEPGGTSTGLHYDVPSETRLSNKRRCLYVPPAGPFVADPLADPEPVPSHPPSSPIAGPSSLPAPTESHPSTSGLPSSVDIIGGSIPRASRRRRRPLPDDAMDLGSDGDSDEGVDSDVEDGSSSFIPWVFRTSMQVDQELAVEEPEPRPLPASSSSDTTTFLPRGLFEFEWRDFPNPPVPPTERREVFSQINCGPTATAPYLTPYDAFIAIWTREFMEYIVKETNRYAQQSYKQIQDGSLGPSSRIRDWQDTDVRELYVFFGLLMGFGMCSKSDVKEFWSKEGMFATPNVGKYMTINRYHLLTRCLHFVNNSTDLRTMTGPQAKIFKIAPVVEHLNHRFQSLYTLSQNIALDESLTLWKGLLNIKQFIKNKAASTGIKTYKVCEAQSGYLWRFKVHAGREEAIEQEATPVSGTIPTLVLNLLQGLENKGHTVWMDNYYNSPALARVLKSKGIDCVGTLRTNRQFVPRQLATLDKSQMEIGQVSGCTSGDVDVMVWLDKNRVAFISTYHGAAVHADRDGITKPVAIRDYNLCMGGVDKKDQMLSAYPVERSRGQVWYKKFFKRLLNASILNAYILYKRSSSDTRNRITNHRDFRKHLLSQILAANSPMSIPPAPSNFQLTPRKLLEHLPAFYELRNDRGKGNERIRRRCKVCHKPVTTYCPGCDLCLCIVDCFKSHHARTFNINVR